MSRTFPVLPPTYYRDHFLEMIGFVTSVYGEMLGEAEVDFIEGFQELPEAAQCLFVRMSNRKRQVFTFDDLDYGEIDDVAGGLEDLLDQGFARRLEAADYRAVLDAMTKPDIVEVARRHGLDIKSGWAKGRLVEHLLSHLAFDDFAADYDLSGFVAPGQRDTLGFLLYLYFGRLNENLLSFTLRDLGVVSVRAQDSYRARFHSLDEARAGYVYTAIVRGLKAGDSDADALFEQLDKLPDVQADFIEGLRNTMLFLLGQGFEKRKDIERAIAVYARATAFDSRERVVRLLHGRGEHERVRTMLEAMLDSPADDEEFIFADDFYRRKFNKVRTSVFTELLRTSEIIEVDELFRGFAEEAAIRHFAADGWSAHHTENGLWPSLFGLIFWEELFETGGMSSGFDLVPQCLKDRSFHKLFALQIEGKLDRVRAGQGLEIVRDTVMNHAGDDNGIVWWSDSLGPVMAQLLMSAPADAVAAVLKRMSEDFYSLRDGFPDLMLTREGRIRFVEIKGEGDAVRRHQLARLNLLKGLGFAADIARVKYRIDPDQTYVVVDVETTGGRAGNDRVTEIGAVKIRGGVVVDEWHSLINPERHIPGYITDLTGISNAMVADAPVFAEVAESFAAFLAGSVFVAHNVNFDHGFIGAEFRRLEMRFRLPKLCTVSTMRKYYPGHESYSLGRLCQIYGIRLENHHRALDDARAAAELLLMVNERRLKAA
jgi:DNA polymerase-3 subunit epsilon